MGTVSRLSVVDGSGTPLHGCPCKSHLPPLRLCHRTFFSNQTTNFSVAAALQLCSHVLIFSAWDLQIFFSRTEEVLRGIHPLGRFIFAELYLKQT